MGKNHVGFQAKFPVFFPVEQGISTEKGSHLTASSAIQIFVIPITWWTIECRQAPRRQWPEMW